ncbi:inositol monophosphatase 3-like [Saccostrea cucullata]|uniref:inositol monophosphatase 3-like n=1 Tax=Saccostrea cuccullata TaxID=36930 RepID=UPI002ED5B9C6
MGPANAKLNPVGAAACFAFGLCMVIYVFGFPDWFQKEQKISLKELLSVSIALVERGGTRVREIRERNTLADRSKGKTKEGADEVLTEGDMESHRAIVYGFAKTFPGLQVISEESDIRPVNFKLIENVNSKNEEVDKLIKNDMSVPFHSVAVWVDPLDATQEYKENLQKFVTVMICVAVNGQPTIGVIHKPFEKKTVWAWVGTGHSSNLKKVENNRKEGDPHNIIISRSHTGDVAESVRRSLGNSTNVIYAGGAGYKTLEVIEGRADAYVHTTRIKKWDICAGNALLSAFHGKMTTLEGAFIDYSSRKEVKNNDGLLATLFDHYKYLEQHIAKPMEHNKDKS